MLEFKSSLSTGVPEGMTLQRWSVLVSMTIIDPLHLYSTLEKETTCKIPSLSIGHSFSYSLWYTEGKVVCVGYNSRLKHLTYAVIYFEIIKLLLMV